jgi:hypothetical protein
MVKAARLPRVAWNKGGLKMRDKVVVLKERGRA